MHSTKKLEVSDLKVPSVVRGVRWCAFMQDVSPGQWLDYSYDLYRDIPGMIVDGSGCELLLDLSSLDNAPYEWWRDFCCRPCGPDVAVRVRCEARERVIVLGTILRAANLAQANLWELQTPANDNRPPRAD